MIDIDETIVAIASPPTPAMRGIVRLSGNDVCDVLRCMGVLPQEEWGKRAFRYGATIDLSPPLGQVPVSVMLWPTGRSYTGQPSAELHTIGSLPILAGCLDAATKAGARAARPGEFTMRAFLAGRMDLTQAEAVLGVIDAEDRGSLDFALRQLAGNLSRPLEQLRDSMLNLLADVEAGLDFVDEDIEFISDEQLRRDLAEITRGLQATLATMQTRGGGSVRGTVVLRGLPNAGKSRLINALVGQDVAIVADVAGTTRDVVAMDTSIDGRPVRFIDTAGIELSSAVESPQPLSGEQDAGNQISRLSQQQAVRAGAEADVRLWCVDASRADFDEVCHRLRANAEQEQTRRSSIDLWVATKGDLLVNHGVSDDWLVTSAVTGWGMDTLLEAIGNALSRHDSQETGSVLSTAVRCRDTLAGALEAIESAVQLVDDAGGHEFVAAELRRAAQCVGEVTGAVYVDDILDRVFSRFCIGK